MGREPIEGPSLLSPGSSRRAAQHPRPRPMRAPSPPAAPLCLQVKARVEGQLKAAAYRTYGTSPAHGAALVAAVLGDAELAAEWRAELAAMAGRIRDMRSALVQALAEAGAPGTWGHITSQIGMFSYTGLTRQQCIHMRNKWHMCAGLGAPQGGGRADTGGKGWAKAAGGCAAGSGVHPDPPGSQPQTRVGLLPTPPCGPPPTPLAT